MTDKLRDAAQQAERAAFESHWYDTYHSGSVIARSDGTYMHHAVQSAWEAWQARAALAQQDAQAVRRKFLANGTRFKMSFFQNEDGEGNTAPGTHVTCFEAFEDELDGRWVALVPAEDDCHLNAAPTPPAQREPLTDEQIAIAFRKGIGQWMTPGTAFAAGFRSAEHAHGITAATDLKGGAA